MEGWEDDTDGIGLLQFQVPCKRVWLVAILVDDGHDGLHRLRGYTSTVMQHAVNRPDRNPGQPGNLCNSHYIPPLHPSIALNDIPRPDKKSSSGFFTGTINSILFIA